jgi:erythromycin esterase-like protein
MKFLPGLILAGVAAACAGEPKEAEVAWLKAAAIPLETCEAGHGFEDLEPLKDLIGDAHVVSLGECTHGTREVFQMKHRLVEYLASRRGFTIFSIEANMPEAYRLNDYVLEGKGDPKALIAGMYFWTWRTEEVLAMVEWMRQYNQSGKGRIEFTGFDMQTPDVAMDVVLAFLKKVDPERVAPAEGLYDPLRSGKFRKKGGQSAGAFGRAVGKFPVDLVKGKKIRFSGWIKTAGVDGYAGLWWRADDPSGAQAFDNMKDRAIHGDSDWKEYALELEVPATAVNVNFGALLSGTGQAWFDGLKVAIDGKPFDVTDVFDPGFEGDAPRGFRTGGDGYDVGLDDHVAKEGTKSLKMAFTGIKEEKSKEQGPDPAIASKSCGDLVAQMEARRDAYLKLATARETDWAIQNARVVHQCLQLETGEVSRDESMAKNVQWILDHAPKDTKIVLWAHNGHVSRWRVGERRSMGSYLDTRYGKDQVIVGFAAGEGTYTAILKDKGLRSDNHLSPPIYDSYEAYFRASGIRNFILDLRKAAKGGKAAAWVRGPHSFRSIGALAMTSQYSDVELPAYYDAIIYLDRTTASRTLKRAP